jgi:hypothetical protein
LITRKQLCIPITIRGLIIKKSYINEGTETSRFIYTYNNDNKIEEYIVMTRIYGNLQMISDANYTYANNILKETRTDIFDENMVKTQTIVRRFESFSPELAINPYSLLNALYQHQMVEIFDDVILANSKQLPIKVTETGNPETGPVTYNYIITNTGKKINKLKCSVKVGNNAPYITNEAVFHY